MSTQKSRESFIIHIMNSGFARASLSFANFIGKNIKISNTQSGISRNNDIPVTTDGKGNLYILVTQIIGELAGKSYLILNEEQSDRLTMLAGHTASVQIDEPMKEALLVEIDNIISAAVISELSEALQVEIYGDVPVLKKIPASSLQEFIAKENGHTDASNSVISTTMFQLSIDKHVHPQFIWKLPEKIFDMIPTERLSVR